MNESEIYEELGKYIVCFQWMENKLKQIGWYLRTPEEPFASRIYFSSKWFRPTVKEVKGLFAEFATNRKLENRNIHIESFNNTMEQCLAVATTRNQLIHSTYVFFESRDQVLGIMRSKLGKDMEDGNRVRFDQQDLTASNFHEPLQAVAELSFTLARWHVQIIHWS